MNNNAKNNTQSGQSTTIAKGLGHVSVFSQLQADLRQMLSFCGFLKQQCHSNATN